MLMERPVTDADTVDTFAEADSEVRFSVSVAGFAQLLRGDPYLQDGYGWEAVAEDASGALGEDEFGYRAEFLDLVERARRIDEGVSLKD